MNKLKILNKGTVKSKELGITLVALVVTIVVLLILAGISIQMLTGDNGILQRAGAAKVATEKATTEENIKLAYLEWQITKLTVTTDTANDFIKNRLNSTIGNVENVSVDDSALTVTINRDNEKKTYYYNIKSGTTKQIQLSKNSNNKNDSYVGYYADINEDGVVDGVIFADLLTGSIKDKQKWGNVNESYEFPQNVTEGNVKKYYISKNNYSDIHFGSNPVISPMGNGEDRFYVMQLNNFTTPEYNDTEDSTKSYPAYTSYYWYKNATGELTTLHTAKEFGTGKQNTNVMIEKWNAAKTANGYDAQQDNQDIWKHIQKKYKEGWFLPSRAEFAAFTCELGVTGWSSGNYNSSFGLSSDYWTSSQAPSNSKKVTRTRFQNNDFEWEDLNILHRVRLATIF